jgi:dihydroorotate dehydrogenase (NAD+) catalytic subunit
MNSDISVKIGRLELKNPIIVASGTFGYGEEFHDNFYDISRLGAVVAKGISLKPMEGNPPPRIVETPSGMLNAIGLQNVGLKKFILEKLPFLAKTGATVIANILGQSVVEYTELAKALDHEAAVSAIELNISCPNVKKGGVQFGTDPKLAAGLVKSVRRAVKKTLIVKLSPNFGDIGLMASRVADAGADAVSAINTITGMAIDVKTRRPFLANITGGLSGPAIRPISVRMVWQVYQVLKKRKIPIIGVGGIMNINDVIEFLLAGATAVQVGTLNFVNPTRPVSLVTELEEYISKEGIAKLSDLTGAMNL